VDQELGERPSSAFSSAVARDQALALRPSDLDAGACTLRVPHGKTGHRTIGLDPEAIAVAAEWATSRRSVLGHDGRRPFLCTLRGTELRPSYVRSMITRLASQAGVERRARPHALRHTKAAELLREGASVRHIQLQLGHSDLSTTASYLESIQPVELVELARRRPSWSEPPDAAKRRPSDEKNGR